LAATLIAVVCVLQFAVPAVTSAEAPSRPNIVVLYLDDVSPHDGRLWNDPDLTPTVYDRFVAHGVDFTNSIGETPLCCPGRSGFLTGLHTHNDLVTRNNAALFHPGMHIGAALKAAGYATMFIGKYFNLDNKLTDQQWVQHGAGWTYLDAVEGINGKFYNYTVHTKEGDVKYGLVHSTQMVADRAVMRFRATPANQPIFAVLSLFNLHAPNVPLPQFVDDPRCADMPPWDPPNYNEADVSDKPLFVQKQPLLPYPDGWPMAGYCTEMLGVDLAFKQIVDELQAEGRLDNTLLVMTADNGMTWGQHRLGQRKLTPYATPVPLYMSFPARWGSEPRKITDWASNIDLAPTLCDLTGPSCTLGPYPTGQTHPDGISLLPLLDDPDAQATGRDAVLETAFSTGRTWQGLRTSPFNPLGEWHYVEWSDGFRELYNLVDDPWELQNLASDPQYAHLRSQLSARLAQLFAEGRATVPRGPDGAIAFTAGGSYKGLNIYSSVAARGQTRTLQGALPGDHDFWVKIINRGSSVDTFTAKGVSAAGAGVTIRYLADTVDVTDQVTASTYAITDLAPNGSVKLVIRMTVDGSAAVGATGKATLKVLSSTDPALVDVVRAVAIR
jgi:arylsulfatase A-like enzyme